MITKKLGKEGNDSQNFKIANFIYFDLFIIITGNKDWPVTELNNAFKEYSKGYIFFYLLLLTRMRFSAKFKRDCICHDLWIVNWVTATR